MFAAASGARLAHRHEKTVKKQNSTSQIEGLQVHCKGFPKHQLRYSDIHGNRYAGIPQRRQNYSSKLYPASCESGLKLSASYYDINGRISKFGHVDFEAALFLREKQELRKKKLKIRRRRYELPSHVATREIAPFPQYPPNSWGKAAWQDRELSHETVRRETICVPNELAISQRLKQREAHKRWVKRNRIQDMSFGDCSSEELIYGVQSGAANLLLYVGLGTMCVGMIIAFVGTGEKGFKTMELRLIGPSLIGIGVLIIILRVLLCVCPSKCLRLKKPKHKLKNSTNKLNSEGAQVSEEPCTTKGAPDEEMSSQKLFTSQAEEKKKLVSIVVLPTTSGVSSDLPVSSNDMNAPMYLDTKNILPVPTVSFYEHEKPCSSALTKEEIPIYLGSDDDKDDNTNLELQELDGNNSDVTSLGTQSSSFKKKFSETPISPDYSDISITSIVNCLPDVEYANEKKETSKKVSKYEMTRNPKNVVRSEIVLTPSNLDEPKATD